MSISITLTTRQADDLHKSIADYLTTAGFTKTCDQFRQEVPSLADYKPEEDARTRGLLVKKWTSVIRLQRKVMDLESRLAQVLEDNAQCSLGAAKRTNPDWLPNANSVKQTLVGHRMSVNAVAFHPIFSVLASASDDSTIKVWDWETGEQERTLKGHTMKVTDCQYDSRGKNLVSCSYDLFIKLWNVENGYQNFATLRGHDHSISSICFTPDDASIISSSRDQTVRIWDISTTHCVKVIQSHATWIRSALPSADGRSILTCGDDHTARILDADTGNMKAELRGHEHVVETAVFVPPAAIPAVHGLSALENLNLPEPNGSPKLLKADALPISYVLTGSRDKKIKLWDALRGTCLHTFVGHNEWVRALVFHPAGNHMLSAADDRTVRIWDLRTGRCLQTIDAHTHFVQAMAWGRQAVGASVNGSRPEGVGAGAEAGAENPKSNGAGTRLVNVLATASADKTIKVWFP